MRKLIHSLKNFDSILLSNEQVGIQQDYEIEGVKIPSGSRCMLFWAAANRDPEKFDNPHEISLERGPHFAFSSGIHYCVCQRRPPRSADYSR